MTLPFGFDFERVVDDFVMLCFFVGNDFLPHLPSMEIREGALDAILVIYKHLLPSLGDYLTDGKGGLNFSKVDVLLADIAKVEEEFFRQHQRNAERNEQRRRREEEQDRVRAEIEMQAKHNAVKPGMWRPDQEKPQNAKELTKETARSLTAAEFEQHNRSYIFKNIMQRNDLTQEQKDAMAAAKLKEIAAKQITERSDKQVKAYVDIVQFGKEGWKMRYYREKFHCQRRSEMDSFCRNIRQSYIEGLAWVFAYYFRGCQSWYWYYPYHYAPFASDLVGCDKVKIDFELGEPAKPFEQLLAVFPQQSRHAIPTCYHRLYDEDSELIDFYPSDVRLDINGARYAWMGVNLLPFIDRRRLQAAMARVDDDEENLTTLEQQRNKRSGLVMLYYAGMPSGDKLTLKDDGLDGRVTFELDDSKLAFAPGDTVSRTYGSLLLEYESCEASAVALTLGSSDQHSSQILPNAKMPPREVDEDAIQRTNRRHFQGEAAIGIVERVLGVPAAVSGLRGAFSGRGGRGGNQNRPHDNGLTSGGFQAMPQMGLGQRRSYQDFNRG